MGNYINNNLIKDEYLIYETNYHWILYFNHLIPSIITLGIYPYLISKFSEKQTLGMNQILLKIGE